MPQPFYPDMNMTMPFITRRSLLAFAAAFPAASMLQLEAYIGSMRRLGDPALDIDVDLTAHPFSTGQTEKIPAIRAHRHGEPHPLVDRNAYLERLERLIAGAERYRRQGARA